MKNVSEISSASDAVMVDRGDLVAEVGFSNLFSAVEKISQITKSLGRPLIMATENLESMTTRKLPSKSEVISLAHSATLGVDCFMLSEETAMSKNRREIVDWLHTFLKQKMPVKTYEPGKKFRRYNLIWQALAGFENLPAIIVSKSGRALFNFMAHRPSGEITILTSSKKTEKVSMLFGNKIKVIRTEIPQKNTVSLIYNIIMQKKEEIFENYDQVIAVYVSEYLVEPRANTISLFDRVDFETSD